MSTDKDSQELTRIKAKFFVLGMAAMVLCLAVGYFGAALFSH